jgi:hypothetical protein
MALINPSLATGQAIYEAGISGFSGFRAKDDAADNKDIYGAYSHRAVDGSATETNEWIGLWEFMIQQMLAGGGSLKVINSTLSTISAGPVVVCGWDSVNTAFQIQAASCYGQKAVAFVLLSDLLAGWLGVAYVGGTFRSSLSTLAAALGDPVYVGDAAMTLTQPSGFSGFSGFSSCGYVQKMGYVASTEASGMIAATVQPPERANGLQLQDGSVANRHYKPEESVNTAVVVGAPSGGRDGDIKIDSTGKIYCRYGGAWHFATLT